MHAGEEPHESGTPVVTPIYQSSSYVLEVGRGDEIIYPGDVLRGDADGVVVVRKDEIEEVIRLSQERDDAERELISLYRAGGTTLDLCNLTEVLKSKGLLVEQA